MALRPPAHQLSTKGSGGTRTPVTPRCGVSVRRAPLGWFWGARAGCLPRGPPGTGGLSPAPWAAPVKPHPTPRRPRPNHTPVEKPWRGGPRVASPPSLSGPPSACGSFSRHSTQGAVPEGRTVPRRPIMTPGRHRVSDRDLARGAPSSPRGARRGPPRLGLRTRLCPRATDTLSRKSLRAHPGPLRQKRADSSSSDGRAAPEPWARPHRADQGTAWAGSQLRGHGYSAPRGREFAARPANAHGWGTVENQTLSPVLYWLLEPPLFFKKCTSKSTHE